MVSIKRFCFCFTCLMGLFFSTFVEATIYPLGDSGWSMVVSSDLTRSNQIKIPRVYSINADSVVIELDKTFFGDTDAYGNFDPLIIEFKKTAVNAKSKIVIRDEYIVNDTEQEWSDFHMFLLVNALAPEAGFDPTQTPYGDQLEGTTYSNYVGYDPGSGNLPIELNFVNVSGSGVLNDDGDDIFRPGFRSTGGYDPIVILTDPDLAVGARIGLKEVPSMPEPTTLLVLLAGLWGWFVRKNKRGALV